MSLAPRRPSAYVPNDSEAMATLGWWRVDGEERGGDNRPNMHVSRNQNRISEAPRNLRALRINKLRGKFALTNSTVKFSILSRYSLAVSIFDRKLATEMCARYRKGRNVGWATKTVQDSRCTLQRLLCEAASSRRFDDSRGKFDNEESEFLRSLSR